MKKSLVIITALFFTLSISAQVVILMEKENGVYKIPCKVNGIKMKFIFDTGASDVCLSMQMAEFLYENGYLEKEDIISTGSSFIADGSIVNNTRIVIKDIEIEGMHLKNVEGVVMQSMSSPLLLGLSAIQKLGRISLEENKLTIWDTKSSVDLDELRRKASSYYENESYEQAAKAWIEYYEIYWLTHEEKSSDYCDIADSYFFNEDYEKAIKWYSKIEPDAPVKHSLIYYRLAFMYNKLGKKQVALKYCKKSIDSNQTNYELLTDTYFMKYALDGEFGDKEAEVDDILYTINYYVCSHYYSYYTKNGGMKGLIATLRELADNKIHNSQLADYCFCAYVTAAEYSGIGTNLYCVFLKYAAKFGNGRAHYLYYNVAKDNVCD